ncbi:MAG: hypothetical protein KDK70_11695, partial [Myxococcales bacterium]|nr:hypothetical protein [Myxococcales bacterium]
MAVTGVATREHSRTSGAWPLGGGRGAACSGSRSGRHCGAVLPVMLTLPGLDWEIRSYGLLLA